jgi:hypothetical protein
VRALIDTQYKTGSWGDGEGGYDGKIYVPDAWGVWATAVQSLFAEQQNAYSTFHSKGAIWGGGAGEHRHLIALLLIKRSSSSDVPYLS